MDESVLLRLNRIHQLAKADETWLALNQAYRADRLAFLNAARDEKISQFLLDYIDVITNMAYRELILACEYMRFPEE